MQRSVETSHLAPRGWAWLVNSLRPSFVWGRRSVFVKAMSTAVSVVQGPPSSGSAASSTPATESKVTTEKQTGAG